MTTVNVYLNYDGNCGEAFNFYKSVFGGEYSYFSRFGEMPPQEGMPPLPESEKNKVMHVALPISAETMLMGSDTMAHSPVKTLVGNNFSLSVNADTIEEADRLFNELSEGGVITMPMSQTFWGAYFGMFTDKFQINWMINVELAPEK